MEVEAPAPLSVAPPTPAIPEETEQVEMNQQQLVEQQPFITSPLNNSDQMLPPGTPVHKSNDPITDEEQVVIIQKLLFIFKKLFAVCKITKIIH